MGADQEFFIIKLPVTVQMGCQKRHKLICIACCIKGLFQCFVTRSREDIRELKNHDDDFVDDDRKWVTEYCASATSKFRRRGVVDDAKQSRITSSCNPQALAGINPLFKAIFEVLFIFLSSCIKVSFLFSPCKRCWLKIRLMDCFYRFEEWQQLWRSSERSRKW